MDLTSVPSPAQEGQRVDNGGLSAVPWAELVPEGVDIPEDHLADFAARGYEVKGLLAEGGQAKIYWGIDTKATDPSTGLGTRYVAIKRLKGDDREGLRCRRRIRGRGRGETGSRRRRGPGEDRGV